MRPAVVQIFPFEVDLGAAKLFAETCCSGERGRAADVGRQQVFKLLKKVGIMPGLVVGRSELLDRGHQCLWHEAAAVGAELAALIWYLPFGRHAASACQTSSWRSAKARSFSSHSNRASAEGASLISLVRAMRSALAMGTR